MAQNDNHNRIDKYILGIHENFIKGIFDNKKYKLDDKYINVNQVALPPELQLHNSQLAAERVNDPKIKPYVARFSKVMLDNFPPNVLINFFNNIKTVTIKRDLSRFFSGDAGVYIGADQNSIYYLDKDSLYHELFHMASSSREGNINFDGLSQYYFIRTGAKTISVSDIGDGINEGYTQLLTNRYFGNGRKSYIYDKEVTYASRVEKIVGTDKMTEYYFNNNLYGLINALAQYSNEERAQKFITDLDYVHKADMKLFSIDRKKMKESINSIKEFLADCYMNKLIGQYERREYNINDVARMYAEFLSAFTTSIRVGPFKYEYQYGIEEKKHTR